MAVAIVGILAAIAYPAYQSTVQRSKRSDAKVELTDAAQRLERCFTRFGAYNNAACGLSDYTTEIGDYKITVSDLTATTYTLTATALTTSQKNDKDCVVLTLDHTGLQGSKNASGTATSGCW
ncbi:pilus assembly protein PilE [bacterium]|nr:pilus assembly protein PilE [bacterium]